MNRELYDSAFKLLEANEQMQRGLESLGLRFEYDDGVLGKGFSTILNHAETVIIAALGLHTVAKKVVCNICGEKYDITIDTLFTDENDDDWSITADDMCEFFNRSIDNKPEALHLRELMWLSMVHNDADARTEYNELGIGLIGSIKEQ